MGKLSFIFFIKYYWDDVIKEDELGSVAYTREMKMVYIVLIRKPEGGSVWT